MQNQQIQEKKMILEQFYNISLQINELFQKKEINEALALIYRKDNIIKKLTPMTNIQDESLKDLQEKIKLQEKNNILLIENMKKDIEKELKKVNKSAQMSQIYNNNFSQGSIIDILE